MGLYATLIDAPIECPACGATLRTAWQFHFGDVSTLPVYRLADAILWDGRFVIGHPSMDLVHAVAYPANDPACDACSTSSILAEVLIDQGAIRAIGSAVVGQHVAALLFEGEGRSPRYYDDLVNIARDGHAG